MKRKPLQLLHDLKPGVSRQTHLFCAALLWTLIGAFLLFRGGSRLILADTIWLCLPAVGLGSFKSIFILDKTAIKSIERINKMADGSCLGAVYSVKTWGLVFVMMLMGYVIRKLSVPDAFTGFLFVTIGWALLFSSRHGWMAWKKYLS